MCLGAIIIIILLCTSWTIRYEIREDKRILFCREVFIASKQSQVTYTHNGSVLIKLRHEKQDLTAVLITGRRAETLILYIKNEPMNYRTIQRFDRRQRLRRRHYTTKLNVKLCENDDNFMFLIGTLGRVLFRQVLFRRKVPLPIFRDIIYFLFVFALRPSFCRLSNFRYGYLDTIIYGTCLSLEVPSSKYYFSENFRTVF